MSLTIAEHIDAALFAVEEHKGSAQGEAWAHDYQLAIDRLVEARSWIALADAKKAKA